jgi:hypothetical protein
MARGPWIDPFGDNFVAIGGGPDAAPALRMRRR